MTDDEQVWITTNWRSSSDVYHTTDECPRLPDDEDRIAALSPDDADVVDRKPCQDPACGGDVANSLAEERCPQCHKPVSKQLAIHLRRDCDEVPA